MLGRIAIEVRYLKDSLEKRFHFLYSDDNRRLKFEKPGDSNKVATRLSRLTFFNRLGTESLRLDLLPTKASRLEIRESGGVIRGAVLNGVLYSPFGEDCDVLLRINSERRIRRLKIGSESLFDDNNTTHALIFDGGLKRAFEAWQRMEVEYRDYDPGEGPVQRLGDEELIIEPRLVDSTARGGRREYVLVFDALLSRRHVQSDWLELGASVDSDQDGVIRVAQIPLTAADDCSFVDVSGLRTDLGPFWLWVVERLPASCVQKLWNQHVEGHLEALEIENGVSFLPRIVGSSDAAHWRSLFLVSPETAITLDSSNTVRAENAGADGSSWRARWLSIQPATSDEGFDLRLEFPRLPTHLGTSLTLKATVVPAAFPGTDVHPWTWKNPCWGLHPENRGIRWGSSTRLVLDDARGGPPQARMMRFGSLDFLIGRHTAGVEDTDSDVWLLTDSQVDPAARIERFSFGARLGVERILPSGQDAPLADYLDRCAGDDLGGDSQDWDEDCLFRRSPVIVPHPFGEPPMAGRLFLDVHEYRSLDRPPRLGLELKQTGASTGNRTSRAAERLRSKEEPLRVVVLDADPFMVAMIEMPPFHVWTTTEQPLIAEWKMLRGWDVKSRLGSNEDEHPFELLLPAPAVGETMERYRTLADGGLADLRLSPPARFEYSTSLVPRNFSEAPWNLRRLLESVSDGELGIATMTVQFELFYGLQCEYEPDFPRLGLRLSEIVSRIGRPVGALPEQFRWRVSEGKRATLEEIYGRARGRWTRFRRQAAARLAILEPWRREIETLELKDGLRCWVRQPAGDAQGVTTPEADADLAHPLDIADADCADGDVKELCGGITWGFESRNVYDAVLRFGDKEGPHKERHWPASSSARAHDLAFSSLGAWGQQRVGFDNDLSVFETASAMGRAYSYRLERIGRIANWWNKARHVIVYERTVVPSRQFACDQNLHPGRPVLRKVREYIEIFEPTRAYPDVPGGTAQKCGPILACSFGDQSAEELPRYNVKSVWGSDLTTVDDRGGERLGWKVPLWRPEAEPSDLYPPPTVRLRVVAHLDGERGEAWEMIANPEDLLFYTDTTAGASGDPDQWPPVGDGVDFVDRPRPGNRTAAAFASGAPIATAAPDRSVPTGLGACTFRLAPSTVEVDVVANRRADPIGTRLETVTLMRANPRPAAGDKPSFGARVGSVLTELVARLPATGTVSAVLANTLKTEARKKLGELEEKVTDLGREPTSELNRYGERAKRTVADLRSFERSTGRRLEAALVAVGGGKGSLKQQIKAQIEVHRDRWRQQAGGRFADVKREALGALQLTPWVRAARDGLALLRTQPGNSVRLARGFFDAARGQLGQAATTLHATLSEIEDRQAAYKQGTEEHQRWLDGHLIRVMSSLSAVRARVQSLASAQPRQQDGTPTPNLANRFANALLPKLATAHKALETFRRDADLTATNVQDAIKQQQQLIGELDKELEAKQQSASSALDAVEAEVNGLMTQLQEISDALLTDDGSPGKQLELALVQTDDWNQQVESAVSNFLSQLETRLVAWIDAVHALLQARVESIATQLAEQIAPWITEGASVVQEEIARVVGVIEEKKKEIDNLVNAEVGKARRKLEAARDELIGEVEGAIDDRLATLEQFETQGKVLYARAEPALNLVRAFGQPPKVSGLDLDRPEVAFFYDQTKKVGITPIIARAQQISQVGEALKPLGLVVPTTEITDRLLPEGLSDFKLSDILPNVGGLDLSNLFSGVRMPPGSRNGVVVKHGYDRETRRAWLRADLNVELGGTQTVFAVGPLALRIAKPHFEGEVKVDGGVQQQAKRRVRGQVSGDWELVVGGANLVRFRDTQLQFDEDAKLRFDLSPEKVELEPTVKFIEGFLQTLSDPDSGFTLAFTGTAVRAQLLLPIPDTSFGAFGITGLSFLAALELHFAPRFMIAMELSLARRQQPFALTIFILGGGGFIEARARYDPSTGKAEGEEVYMALTASAGLSIALGPIKGGVFVYFGVTGQYVQGGSGLDLGIMLMVRGYVSVLSIASASVALTLRAYYQGGSLVGEGRVEIKIKICWCFTLKVNKSVTYTLAGSGGGGGGGSSNGRLGPRAVTRIAQAGGDLPLDASEEAMIKADVEQFARDYVEFLV